LAHTVFEAEEDASKQLSDTTDESYNDFSNYLVEDSVRIKERLNERANVFYQMALKEFRDKNFSKSVQTLKKAISLNSNNISFFLLKYESFVQLCDFNSGLLTINRILSIMKLWPNKSDLDYNELKSKLNEKTIFCHYMMGQSYFDLKQYLDALNSFNKASELQPSNLLFKIRR
jgi:tetratricopeptide (TPR) repeat protein